MVADTPRIADRTLQGLERTDKPAFSFQGHPEASPGPHDLKPLFQRFTSAMKAYRHTNAKNART